MWLAELGYPCQTGFTTQNWEVPPPPPLPQTKSSPEICHANSHLLWKNSYHGPVSCHLPSMKMLFNVVSALRNFSHALKSPLSLSVGVWSMHLASSANHILQQLLLWRWDLRVIVCVLWLLRLVPFLWEILSLLLLFFWNCSLAPNTEALGLLGFLLTSVRPYYLDYGFFT